MGSAPDCSTDTFVTAVGVAPNSNVVPSVPIDMPGRGEPSAFAHAPATLSSEPANVRSPHTRLSSGASRYCVPLIVHARPSGNVPAARFGIAIGCVGTGGSTGPLGSSGLGSTAATVFCHSPSLTACKLEANESRSSALDARRIDGEDEAGLRVEPHERAVRRRVGRRDHHAGVVADVDGDGAVRRTGKHVSASAVPCDADTAIEGSCGWLRSSGPW